MVLACSGLAAQAATPELTSAQQEGRLHFQQSCAICHTQPTIVSPLYGPALSQATFEPARDAQLKDFITNGTPNMPGFKYQFTAAQIDTILAYLKTVPVPPPPAPAAPR
jgi:mono/diheme cytochrome c family protein